MSAEPLRAIEGGGAPRGWERLWAKDVWRRTRAAARRLGVEVPRRGVDAFERIVPAVAEGGREALGPWAAAGRHGAADDERATWSSVGISAQWLAEHAPEVSAPALLSRAVLEDYMLWVRHEAAWKPATRNQRLLAVRLLLGGAARGWAGGAAARCCDPRRRDAAC